MVAIREVGLRDAVHASQLPVPTAFQCDWILLAYAAGLREIEVGVFRAGEAAARNDEIGEVVAFAATLPDLCVSVMAHDEVGARQAIGCGAAIVTLPLPASEAYCHASTGRPLEAMLADLRRLCAWKVATGSGVRIEAAVSTAFGAADGPMAAEIVLERVEAAIDAGCDGVMLADTYGRADRRSVATLCVQVRAAAPKALLTAHLHGDGVQENVAAAIAAGVDRIDAVVTAFGNPAMPAGSKGNVSVEAVAAVLQAQGLASDVDLKTLGELDRFAGRQLARTRAGSLRPR